MPRSKTASWWAIAGRQHHRPLSGRLRVGAGRQDSVHRRGAQPDGRRLGRVDSVPRARRRQPRVDGLQHAAPGGAAVDHRAADRGHRHGEATWPRTRACSCVARKKGTVTYVDAERIEIGERSLSHCASTSASTSAPARTRSRSSKLGQKVEKGEVIADGAATFRGELALGRNVLVGFMAWDGFNFEDAIIISEELVKQRHLHVDPHRRIRHRNSRDEAGPRGVHPRYSQRQRKGPAQSGRRRASSASARTSGPGDILVGKVSPKSKTELTPEEKLLHAIFGRAGEDVKNDSLEVPSGVEGIVIDTQKFSRRLSLSEDERKVFEKALKDAESEGNAKIAEAFGAMVDEIEGILQRAADRRRRQPPGPRPGAQVRGRAGRAVQARLARHPQPAAEGGRRKGLQDRAGRPSKRPPTIATAS